MTEFMLRHHVFACITDSGGFFLDAARDSYFGLSASQMQTLTTVLQGWPQYSSESLVSSKDAVMLAEKLVHDGLLTRDPTLGKSAKPATIEPVDTDIEWGSRNPKVRFHHLKNFFLSKNFVVSGLRSGSAEQIIQNLLLMKEQYADSRDADSEAACEIAYIFRKIRPLSYSHKDKCLFDALVTMRFMIHYGLSPLMVYGIKDKPFSAHCWIQIGHIALNCSAEYANSFTPIRVI